jgi:acid phosphatase family membrane protein YuiD
MKIFFVCLTAWFIAQLIKVIINLIKYYNGKRKGIARNKVTLATLFKLGGMPSSHTATVISLCGCIGLLEGFDSNIFAACGVFAFIVMFDAFKVRLPISRLTDAFNRLQGKVCGDEAKDVKKVEGHTIPEIIGGFILGLFVAFIMVKYSGLF